MSKPGPLFGQDGRLRSGWRFAIYLASFVLISLFLGTAALSIAVAAGVDIAHGGAGFLVINALLSTVPAIFLAWLCGKYLEGIPFRELGIALSPGWLKHLTLGILVGTLTLTVAVGISVAFGGLSFRLGTADPAAMSRTLVYSLAVFVVAAAFEEILFRGYAMQTFFRSGLAWFGILLTSLLFAAVHQGNPRADFLSWSNTFIAGFWFALAYWKTRDLWMSFGMHLMWNWMQGAVFGIEVSGLTDITSAPLLNEIDRGPAWLTGETYGIEAGLACTAALILSIAAIYFYKARRPAKTTLTQLTN